MTTSTDTTMDTVMGTDTTMDVATDAGAATIMDMVTIMATSMDMATITGQTSTSTITAFTMATGRAPTPTRTDRSGTRRK
ncbi:MAG: hypothetical protein ACQEQJ_06140 [Halobacteriota archaeon]